MDRYKYTIEFWDDFDKKMQIHCGYVMGASFKDAMENIEKYYGDDTIEKIYLQPERDGHVIILQDDMEKFDSEWESPAKNFYC